MFGELFEEIINTNKSGINLVEALTKTQVNQIRKEVATPEILPCDFDATIPGWIERIKLWGKIEIYHKDPENFRGKRKVTATQFINKLASDDLKKMLSSWFFEKKGLAKVKFYKDYIGKNGKMFTEEFFIRIKLRKELKGLKLF